MMSTKAEREQQAEADAKKRVKPLTDEQRAEQEKSAKKQALDQLNAKESPTKAAQLGEAQSGTIIQAEDVAAEKPLELLPEEKLKLGHQPEKLSHEPVQQAPVQQPGYLPGRKPSEQPVEDHENDEYYAQLRKDQAEGKDVGSGFERAEVFIKKS